MLDVLRGVAGSVFALGALLGGCTSPDDDDDPPRGYSSIATATSQSCVLDAEGAAWCWGELGLAGATTVTPAPVAVGGALRFASLSAGGAMVCGVAEDATAHCWGPNDHGQLGLGTIGAGSATPVLVGTGRLFASIAAGDPTSCGITPAGQALCWGSNALGQVGADVGPTDVQSPLPIALMMPMRQISISADFACGVTTTGAAYCWGSNASGQLGTGGVITPTDLSRVPVLVGGGHTWRAVTTGDAYACGVTTGGVAHCWGRNEARLGNGSTAASSTPVAVAIPSGRVVTSIDAGRDFACATTGAGDYCWGSNVHGQLGSNTAAGSQPSATPVAIAAAGTGYAEVSASDGDHACAITTARDAVYCWGRNHVGQLGIGATGTAPTLAPVRVGL
ncbi:MAG: hypothetical protein M3680_19580 [Myxococcota bacterium]|nr:hypothetical protein [Myxococcota bacterium]